MNFFILFLLKIEFKFFIFKIDLTINIIIILINTNIYNFAYILSKNKNIFKNKKIKYIKKCLT